MAFNTPTNPNNQNYLVLGGIYTGTVDEYYQVKVRGSHNSETWIWRYKGEGSGATVTGITSDISNNKFTKSNHNLVTGEVVKMSGFTFTSAGNPGTQGIQTNHNYYVIRLSSSQFQLASSDSNANSGTALPLSGTSESDLQVVGEWSAWYDKDGDVNNTGDAIVVDTAYTLRNGITVTFTRTNANAYTAGDRWEFTAYADYTFDLVDGDIQYIQAIDIADDRNLLAIDSNGDVSVIKNIDSDEPSIANLESNIGPVVNSNLDFENKNKELYIAKGVNRPARWLGYNKNEGMQGKSEELNLKSQPAMDVLVSSIETPDRNAFYKSIALRAGGGASTKDARVIVGLKDDDENKFYVYNVQNDIQYTITVESKPYIIRKFIGIFETSNYYTDGFYIVRESNSSDANEIAEVDIFDLDTSNQSSVGQSPQRKTTMIVTNPIQNSTTQLSGLNKIHDLLMISKFAPAHSSYDSDGTAGGNGTSWDFVISASRDCFKDYNETYAPRYEWLWKASLDGVGIDFVLNNNNLPLGGTNGSGWDNITPTTCATQGDINNPENIQVMHPQGTAITDGTYYRRPPGWYYVFVNGNNARLEQDDIASAYGTWTDANTPDMNAKFMKFHFLTVEATGVRVAFGIKGVPNLHSLEFCGYDNEGANPIIAWTCELNTPMYFNGASGFMGEHITAGYISQVLTGYEQPNAVGDYYGSDVFGPVYLDGSDGNGTESNAMTVVNDLLKKQEARPLRWITNFIPISTVSGPQQFKMLSHTVDYERQTTADLIKEQLNLNENANISEILPYQDNTIGHLNLDSVPKSTPLFGMNGRFNVLTEGNLRRRAVMTYIRPNNRQYGLYRFGDEQQAPMDLQNTDGLHPTLDIFPNDWNQQSSNFLYNAYTQWEKGLGQTNYVTDYKQGNTYFYANTTAANHTGQKTQYLPILGSSGNDKTGYRLTETNWWAPSTDWKDSTTSVWHPNADVADYAYAIKNEGFQDIAFFKMVSRTGGTTTNQFASGTNYFNITTPTQITGTDWAGPDGVNTAFYRASLVLDGYQETAFISTTAAGPAGSDNDDDSDGTDVGTHLKVTVQIEGSFVIPSRVTGVAVYRAISTIDASTDPQSQYRFIQEIPLNAFSWNPTSEYWEFDVVDTGDAEATYEAINGISENIYNLHINYSCNTQTNGYMFVGNCHHSEIEDASNYLFRSQPSKYSIFDWSKDFVQLPFVPVALQGFQGKVFCFGSNQMSMVNPETLYIEDTVEGIGCIGTRSKMVTDAGFVWADYRNIYLSTPQINNIGNTILNVDDYGWLNLSNAEKDDVRFGYDARRKAVLVFFCKTIGSTTYPLCWAYSLGKQRWDLWQTDQKVKDTLLTKDGHTLLLLQNNKIQKYLSRTSERADWEWHSKKLGMGETMVDKKVRNIKVEGSDRTNISLQYKVPENSSAWQSGTDISSKFSGSTNSAIKLANADSGKLHWVKLKIAGSNTGRDVRARAASVIYKPKRPK